MSTLAKEECTKFLTGLLSPLFQFLVDAHYKYHVGVGASEGCKTGVFGLWFLLRQALNARSAITTQQITSDQGEHTDAMIEVSQHHTMALTRVFLKSLKNSMQFLPMLALNYASFTIVSCYKKILKTKMSCRPIYLPLERFDTLGSIFTRQCKRFIQSRWDYLVNI